MASAAQLAGCRNMEEGLTCFNGRVGPGRRYRLVGNIERSCSVRSLLGGEKTGPNPTDRGKNGSKRHVIVDGNGTPLAIEHTGANVHDSEMAITLVDAVEPIKRPQGHQRKRPKAVYANRAYDVEEKIRQPLRDRDIVSMI
jgi:hypothetical protein